MTKAKKPQTRAMKSKKKRKTPYQDDGHTVYNMDNVVRQNPFGPDDIGKDNKKDNVGLSRKERFAAIRAAFQVYLPILLGVLICFALAGLLLVFWLKQKGD